MKFAKGKPSKAFTFYLPKFIYWSDKVKHHLLICNLNRWAAHRHTHIILSVSAGAGVSARDRPQSVFPADGSAKNFFTIQTRLIYKQKGYQIRSFLCRSIV
jgi:hypothetical protein